MQGAPVSDNPAQRQTVGVTLRLRGVSRTFPGGTVAVAPIDLDVVAGEFLAILGPSGCGKSTLLRIVARLDRPTAGTIETATPEPRVAYVFQDAHLLPWRDVLQNVALPLELSKVNRSARLDAAAQVLRSVGLADALKRYPAQLSGGMRMRASLARALVTNPDLLLLDEPFAALDEITRQSLDEQLRSLWRQRAMTVVFVTHSIGEAAFLARRAVVLSRRPARIVLDHQLALPEVRNRMLRGEPEFASQVRLLLEALELGGSF